MGMPQPIVLITEPLATGPLDWIRARADVREIRNTRPSTEDLTPAQALVVRTYTRVDEALLDRAPNLRVVARAGVGLDNIDVEACRARGVRVVHTPAANTEAVVEYVISMMLGTLRPIERLEQPISGADWKDQRDRAISPRSCVGARLGLVGMGRIGSRVARCARALCMRVAYNDLLEIDPQLRAGATPVQLDSLAKESEVISVHVDGRDENTHLLDASFFSKLRDDVVLINASRGHVIDTDAAVAFAASHPGVRLILDVHDPEPVPLDSALWHQPNITITPHIGAGTRQAKETMSWVVRDVMRVLDGETPHHPAW